jgi:hypothetical protein
VAARARRFPGDHVASQREWARQIAEAHSVKEGLVCVFSVLEPCSTFRVVYRKGKQTIRQARRKCLFLYYYFMDPVFGLIHVKVQTWFPFMVQVYVNAHEWLARKMDDNRIGYLKYENAFLSVADANEAQQLSDRFAKLRWPKLLDHWARKVNPLLGKVLGGMSYYWTTAQAEYATDVMFKSRQALADLMPRRVQHSMQAFDAHDVMGFLGRKLDHKFQGEITSGLFEHELRGRLPGRRVKHTMKRNWIKMYDKTGVVLRIETVINLPNELKVRRRVRRKGRRVTLWTPMRKGVAYLFRYRDISLKCNERYLTALAVVDDPSDALAGLDRLTTRRRDASQRSDKPFNPLAKQDRELFRAVLSGDHLILGLRNRDLRERLRATSLHRRRDQMPGHVSRLLARLHVYGLIAKIPRSRRWRVTNAGHRLMVTALRLREDAFPMAFAAAA